MLLCVLVLSVLFSSANCVACIGCLSGAIVVLFVQVVGVFCVGPVVLRCCASRASSGSCAN